MKQLTIPADFYLSMLEFLLNAKQRIITIGATFDLTGMQTITLLLASASEPRSMSGYCKMYHCDASNMTGIIDGLEQKGLVTRKESPNDRRVKVIQLEPAGRKLCQQILKQVEDSSGSLLSALTAEEGEQFIAIIKKLAPHSA